METLEIIKSLCKEHGISLSKLEKILGYGNASLSKAKVIPSDRILEISKYFDVSMEYLMTGKEKDVAFGYYYSDGTAKLAQEMFEDADMRSLFDMKRNMPPERFKAHMEFMKNLYNQEKGTDL